MNWGGASLFFSLAMIGVVLPGVPTTPFLLLMCYFLARASPEWHAKALQWPLVGEPLRDWHDQGGVRWQVKALAIAMVTALVGSTIVFSPLNLPSKLLIMAAAVIGIYVVIRLPTAKDDQA
jgi:uncharacterized membrane protein YbaN (DUF454 family)